MKSRHETKQDLKKEISSIENKGYNTILIHDREHKDKRRFTKIFDIRLNKLIFESDIDRKYINFFILLVNTNSRYIEPDLNLIALPIKKIAENMEYTTVYIYNCLKVLKEHNLIDYYRKGKSNFIVINPCYFSRFYDIRYLYFLEIAFEKHLDITDIIDRIIVLKNTRHNKKDAYIEGLIKEYIAEHISQK